MIELPEEDLAALRAMLSELRTVAAELESIIERASPPARAPADVLHGRDGGK